MKNEIIRVINNLRPYLQKDGGDVRFIDVDKLGVVSVQLLGACRTCPSSMLTIKQIIEEQLLYEVEGVTAVAQV